MNCLSEWFNESLVKGVMWFQVLLSLWGVTSWLCVDKIPEVTKTKVSKPKRYSLSKLRLVHVPLKRLIQTPPHITRWEDLHNTAQTYTQKKEGMIFILAVDLLLPPALCPGDAVKEKLLSLGFQKRTHLEITEQNSSTQILDYVKRNLWRTNSWTWKSSLQCFCAQRLFL